MTLFCSCFHLNLYANIANIGNVTFVLRTHTSRTFALQSEAPAYNTHFNPTIPYIDRAFRPYNLFTNRNHLDERISNIIESVRIG